MRMCSACLHMSMKFLCARNTSLHRIRGEDGGSCVVYVNRMSSRAHDAYTLMQLLCAHESSTGYNRLSSSVAIRFKMLYSSYIQRVGVHRLVWP